MSNYAFMFAKRMTMDDSTNIVTRMTRKQNFIELHLHNLICLRRPWMTCIITSMSCINFVNVVKTNVCEAVNNPKISNTLTFLFAKLSISTAFFCIYSRAKNMVTTWRHHTTNYKTITCFNSEVFCIRKSYGVE